MAKNKTPEVIEEKIISTDYSEVMQKSYIDYAMSVIISRALPDIRDGLKPVQRRTLYDMYELGIKYDKPYRKCARIVGDTMGKYHPHGDTSIYESLVVMSQDFKKEIPLVDGHGNFGSIEGDGAAAMRYTEARLQKITQEAFLQDLDKDVVDFMPNFDETDKEPTVLPVRIPNFLVNGSEGIAVGMTTSTPPHNLGEVIDAVKAYMKDNDISNEQLMKYIPGPDFPTGGIVINKDELPAIYSTGQGKIKIRGKVEYEKGKNGHEYLVITEIPYTMIGAGIGNFLSDVAELVENKVTNDIIDISNQSSKEGIRIVLELRRGADVELIKNMLYKKTNLENTFSVNMLAVADGRPEILNLKGVIEHFLDFQYDITTRKYQTLLNKELDKKEIQEGLIRACDIIDLIIEILRGSKNVKMAKDCLVNGNVEGIKFKSAKSKKEAQMLMFTDRQAQAILDMRLYKLIGLEIDVLNKEHEETLKNIETYSDILDNYDSMSMVIKKDLDMIKKSFAVPRRTLIENGQEAVFDSNKIQEQTVYFLMDRFNYCRSIDEVTYERNKETADTETPYVLKCSNLDKICIFTDLGNMHTLKMTDVPIGKFRGKTIPIDNISGFDTAKERVLLAIPSAELENNTFVFASTDGLMKKVPGDEFIVGKRTIASTKLPDDVTLVSVNVLGKESHVILRSHDGYFTRFQISEVPDKKRANLGQRCIKLGANDYITDAYLVSGVDGTTITVDDTVLPVGKIKLFKRDSKGVKLHI